MNVLALDTASPLPAVALSARGQVFEERILDPQRASEELLLAVERALERGGVHKRELSRIAVCAGPGSFTGLRIGLATAWGLGSGLRIPFEAASTLEAMAEAARRPGLQRVAAALHAGRGEAVIGIFELVEPRVRSLREHYRVPIGEALLATSGCPVVSLPPDLVESSLTLSLSPAGGLALAVAKAPREGSERQIQAIYSRASAAEEKRGSPRA